MADRIPEGWKECKLGEVAEIIKDKYIPTKGDSLSYIGLEHIEEQKLRLNSIGSSEDITSDKFYFRKGDILFGKLRPYFRKVVQVDFDGVCSTDIWVIRSKAGVNQKYLFYLFANKELVDLSNSSESGTRMPRADWNFMSQTMWNIPIDQSEQRAIASVLSSLDDKIDLLNRENQTLEKMAEALFRQWFIEEADEKLEEVKLKNLVDFEKGKKPQETFQLQMPGLVPQVLIETFDDGNVMYSKPDGMVIANENDILIVMDGASSGRVEIGFSGIVGSTIGLFQKRSDFPYSLFLYYFLKSKEDYIREHTTGSAIPHADKALILNLDVKFSNIAYVKKFELITKDLFEKLKLNRSQIRTLEKLRDTLLPKLMSGEVRVKL